ncbi:MAG: molecular chaperone TorD family protein [Gammaproteobacteria bacterium]|nr:molecular chaperone TorD family protein [Gammaproteobacteria bacterium]
MSDPGEISQHPATLPGVLAQLLGRPDEDSLPALQILCEEHAWLSAPFAELQVTPLDRWQAEHTRLFVNGYPRTLCPPFESIHRHGRMEGPACDELKGLYRRAGLMPSDGLPADYLGTMLEFSAWLCAQGTDEAKETLLDLRSGHLDNWVPRFSRCVREKSQLRLYRELGEKMESWVASIP